MQNDLPAPPAGTRGWPWEANETPPMPWQDPASLPWISVVTPSLNQGEYLEATLRSVLLQQYPKLQYIVVDGGSTDQSPEILDKYAHLISQVIRERDRGQSDAIYKGMRLAQGQFVNWINSDDMLKPNVLWELARHFHEPIDLYTFPVAVEGEGVEPYIMYNRNLSARAILRADRYAFSQPGLWFRTAQMWDCGGIDRGFNYGFDWDLLIRYLSKHPRVHYSKTIGASFRLHSQSKTMLESSKAIPAENQFVREAGRIRDKLENTLPESLARASRLGRLREPWHQHLIAVLDDVHRSPMDSVLAILRGVAEQPRARLSARTFGSVARLLSRYVRRWPPPPS